MQWTFSSSSEEDFKCLPEQNKTLVIAAINVANEKASGCYVCECGNSEHIFTVQVGLPGEHWNLMYSMYKECMYELS